MKNDKTIVIEFRSIRVDLKYLYDYTWPDLGEISVNDKKIMDLKPLQNNSSLKRRKDDKITLTLTTLKEGINKIAVKEYIPSHDQKQNHRIDSGMVHLQAIYLVRRLTSEQFLGIYLKEQSNYVPVEQCKELIQNQSKSDTKYGLIKIREDVKVEKVKVSLRCDISF